jgi:hypothetical protein
MARYNWKPLSKQQVGAYAEYFVKMEFTMHNLQVYSTEVDDHGIDFVARQGPGSFIEVQVKSLRSSSGYVFVQKEKFCVHPSLYLALVILLEGEAPKLYLIPSTAWLEPNGVLVVREYEGLKSPPEYGINLSAKSLPILGAYLFDSIVAKLGASGREDPLRVV